MHKYTKNQWMIMIAIFVVLITIAYASQGV